MAVKGITTNGNVYGSTGRIDHDQDHLTRQGKEVALHTIKNLTPGAKSVNMKSLKNVRGVAIAVLSLPRIKKVLLAVFAISALWRDQIGMAATSGTREGPAVSNGLGNVATMPFFNPKPFGGSHV